MTFTQNIIAITGNMQYLVFVIPYNFGMNCELPLQRDILIFLNTRQLCAIALNIPLILTKNIHQLWIMVLKELKSLIFFPLNLSHFMHYFDVTAQYLSNCSVDI